MQAQDKLPNANPSRYRTMFQSRGLCCPLLLSSSSKKIILVVWWQSKGKNKLPNANPPPYRRMFRARGLCCQLLRGEKKKMWWHNIFFFMAPLSICPKGKDKFRYAGLPGIAACSKLEVYAANYQPPPRKMIVAWHASKG